MGFILLLHSGRDDSRDAEEYAFEVAMEEKKKLVCLHVLDPIGYYGVVKHYGRKNRRAMELKKRVEKKAAKLNADFEFLLMEGNTCDTVKDYIKENEGNIDTIIFGSTRKRIHEKLFFGSVSERVLKVTKGKYHPTIILKKMR